ncbi:MAG: hypothetical protein H6723_19415, partial [Sandaracinus sp.]|nr:hypothetical protein [Sandaracinus sp.]
YACYEEALSADPSAADAVDCNAESFWKLDRCASSSTCEEGKTERCIDEHRVRLTRCPGASNAFVEVRDLCIERIVIGADPATRYVDAVQRQFGHSYAWRDCMLQMFEVNEAFVRDHAVCAVPHIERFNTCESTGEPSCQHLLTPSYACPPMPQELLDWQVLCNERH